MPSLVNRSIFDEARNQNAIEGLIGRQNNKETVVISRPPSTANLFIDSLDRTPPSDSTDFTITKQNNILTGFFTRFAVVEVVLDYCIPNINSAFNTDTFIVNVASLGARTITLETGHYNVKQLIDYIVLLLNDAYSSPGLFVAKESDSKTAWGISCGSNWVVNETELSKLMNITDGDTATIEDKYLECPKLLPHTYIDIVSPTLTYAQDVKDGSTALRDNNVLYRWYFGWESPPDVDAYGYPIYQGYTPFLVRRYLACPKQIKWDSNLPIGQISFQVLDSAGEILPNRLVSGGEMEFQMTLLVSEN